MSQGRRRSQSEERGNRRSTVLEVRKMPAQLQGHGREVGQKKEKDWKAYVRVEGTVAVHVWFTKAVLGFTIDKAWAPLFLMFRSQVNLYFNQAVQRR